MHMFRSEYLAFPYLELLRIPILPQYLNSNKKQRFSEQLIKQKLDKTLFLPINQFLGKKTLSHLSRHATFTSWLYKLELRGRP